MTEATRPLDTAPAAAPNPTGEPSPSPEILDLPKYVGLYGRILVATKRPDDPDSVLKPDSPVGQIPEIKFEDLRDYTPITWNLSATERVEAWGETPFARAYEDWKTKFTNAINAAQKRKEAFAIISGKQADQFSKDDTDILYKKLCEGKSDTTEFTRTVVDNLLGGEGKVNPEKLQELKTQIEWIAGRLFGKQTASVVARMVEIEASIKNEAQAAIDAIISKPERINILTPEERKILAPVYKKIVEGPPPGFEVVPVAPLQLETLAPAAGGAAPAPKKEPEPQPAAARTATGPSGTEIEPADDVIALTAKTADELKRKLIYSIGQNPTTKHLTFGMSEDNVRGLLSSVAGDQMKDPGKIEFAQGNRVNIKNLKIEAEVSVLGRMIKKEFDIDVVLFNDPDEKGEIDIQITRGPRGVTGLIEGRFRGQIRAIKPTLSGLLIQDHPRWKADNVAIDSEKQRITLGFHPMSPMSVPVDEDSVRPAVARGAPEPQEPTQDDNI